MRKYKGIWHIFATARINDGSPIYADWH